MGLREVHEELGSTQERAIALARNGAGEGTTVVARRQTRGRGRLDHVWSSPPGGLYLSVVLDEPHGAVSWLPLGIAGLLARSIADRYGVALSVQWPNDIVAVGSAPVPRKLAGVLLDALRTFDGRRSVVAGIGLNVAPTPASTVAGRRATSLYELTSLRPSLDELESVVVDAALDARRELDQPAGVRRLQRTCRALLFGVGRRVTVDGVAAGRIADLAVDGALRLEDGASSVEVRAGEVRFSRPP